MQNKNNEINYGKDLKINETDKCIIAIMDDFQDITCTISMFKDFFDIKFNIPNIRNLDMELQAQSYI